MSNVLSAHAVTSPGASVLGLLYLSERDPLLVSSRFDCCRAVVGTGAYQRPTGRCAPFVFALRLFDSDSFFVLVVD